MGFILVVAFGFCVWGSLIVAAALGFVPKTKLLRYRCLRGAIMGATLGGFAALFVIPLVGGVLGEVSAWLAGVLVKLGFPTSVLKWSDLYIVSGALSLWMALGAGLGWWWMKREKAK